MKKTILTRHIQTITAFLGKIFRPHKKIIKNNLSWQQIGSCLILKKSLGEAPLKFIQLVSSSNCFLKVFFVADLKASQSC